ncbi:MAG: ATP-binding cassette domain-containing protein, partial [Saprospiraceae bacterium]
LLRLFDIEQGKILIDDREIKEYDINALRRLIGYVPQDQFLFSESIEDNIRFGTPLASDEQVTSYTRYAAIYEEIATLPAKLKTLLGERGVTLSGGQKQRIAIARALIKNPDILLMDDCLSAIDTRTEKAILEAFDEVLTNKTSILITHRISHLAGFTKIMVLHKGRLAEMGTHEELLELHGHYFDLMEQQKWEDSEAADQLAVS